MIEREIEGALPPHVLLPGLERRCGARVLEALGDEGWGTQPGGQGAGIHMLAAEPCVEFSGGLEALREAKRWLAEQRKLGPGAAVLVGWLSYDLGREFEELPVLCPDDPPVAPVCLGAFAATYRYDPATRCGRVLGSEPRAVARLVEHVRAATARPLRVAPAAPLLPGITARTVPSDAEFRSGVRAIQSWIHSGDVYQVNLSRRLDLSPVAARTLPLLYERLAARTGSPFSAYLESGEITVLSNSPERFLRVVGDQAETCPIKGTRPRGRTPEEDAWLGKDLISAEKDRAEHLMIVDLERNDLGRICRTGTIRVARLAALRSFPTVHHLVSSVRGQLRDPEDWLGILRGTFPGGSITGAPKLRAMEIIEELEPVRRGIYTGALGYFDSDGGIDLSVAIRTAVGRDDRLSLHLGGGIVADSDPEAELEETRDKGRAFSALWETR